MAVNPPETQTDHKIRSTTLAGLLISVQRVVKHAYGRAFRELAPSLKSEIHRADAHVLNVMVPAKPGSFRVLCEGAHSPGLMGESELSRALAIVTALFARVDEPRAAVDVVKAYKGHLAAAYLSLLNFLIEIDSNLACSWAEPEFSAARSFAISRKEVQPIIDLASTIASLTEETITLTGALMKVDVDRGTWRLEDAEHEHSGQTRDGGPSLAGLTTGLRYSFNCLEEYSETETGREVRHLKLISFQPA